MDPEFEFLALMTVAIQTNHPVLYVATLMFPNDFPAFGRYKKASSG